MKNFKALVCFLVGTSLFSVAAANAASVQPYVSDKDHDVNQSNPPEIYSAFLTTTGIPLQITTNSERDAALVQGGAIFTGITPGTDLIHFSVDLNGTADSTHGPFLAIDGVGTNLHSRTQASLRVPLSSLRSVALRNGYTRYVFYPQDAGFLHFKVADMGIYVTTPESTGIGPYLLNNFDLNAHLLGKTMSSEDLSPNFPF